MGWEVLIPIIAREGLLVAMKLWQLSRDSKVPTEQDWNDLQKLAGKKYEDYFKS